jgi:hypothetical protein
MSFGKLLELSFRTSVLWDDRFPLDTSFWTEIPCTRASREMLREAGVRVVRLPAQSPDLNCYAKRWVRPVKSVCLSRVIPLGERHLRQLLSEYLLHFFHREGNHQGLHNRIRLGISRIGMTDNPPVRISRFTLRLD